MYVRYDARFSTIRVNPLGPSGSGHLPLTVGRDLPGRATSKGHDVGTYRTFIDANRSAVRASGAAHQSPELPVEPPV